VTTAARSGETDEHPTIEAKGVGPDITKGDSGETRIRVLADLGQHVERYVTGKRCGGSDDLNSAGGGAGGYRGYNFRARNHCEDGRSAVKTDARRAG